MPAVLRPISIFGVSQNIYVLWRICLYLLTAPSEEKWLWFIGHKRYNLVGIIPSHVDR
jgi:hypothetical protein